MVVSLLAVAVLCQPPAAVMSPGVGRAPRPAADSLRSLYESGRTWQAFLDAARARRTLWVDNYEQGTPEAAMVARAEAVGGSWRFLVVAVDSCSDSANTIPFLARLVERVPGLELRIVAPGDGRWVMESHRTDDGRAATPTVLLLDHAFQEQGCFIERPAALRRLLAERGLSEEERYERKMAWYRDDRGSETVRDLVELLEAAAAGTPKCDARP